MKVAFKLDIGGNCVEKVLLGAQDISLPPTPSFLIMHWNTSNRNQNQPKNNVSGITKIDKNFTKKYSKIKPIITGMLPWDKT